MTFQKMLHGYVASRGGACTLIASSCPECFAWTTGFPYLICSLNPEVETAQCNARLQRKFTLGKLVAMGDGKECACRDRRGVVCEVVRV
jgi:hypothetical protein